MNYIQKNNVKLRVTILELSGQIRSDSWQQLDFWKFPRKNAEGKMLKGR